MTDPTEQDEPAPTPIYQDVIAGILDELGYTKTMELLSVLNQTCVLPDTLYRHLVKLAKSIDTERNM